MLTAPRPSYIPSTGEEFSLWLENFVQHLRPICATFGVAVEDVDKLAELTAGLKRIQSTLSTYKQIHMAYSAVEKLYVEGQENEEVVLPVLAVPPPGGVLSGGLLRLAVRLAEAVRASAQFTPALGTQLGIYAHDSHRISPDVKPQLGPWHFKDKVLLVLWRRGAPFTAVEFFIDNGNGRGFVSNGRDHHPPVAIWDKLPRSGGILRVKAQGYVDNVPVGVMSDILEITVPPHYLWH